MVTYICFRNMVSPFSLSLEESDVCLSGFLLGFSSLITGTLGLCSIGLLLTTGGLMIVGLGRGESETKIICYTTVTRYTGVH